ncbi:hypothetical protein C8T65DRAFT_734715 [Cerioporus squamosus]|nr:hypothetical protein C8T65DRAFT_734715 [Cerioporus squamosus]
MDVDADDSGDDAPSPDPRTPPRPTRGKGKARAVTPEYEEDEEDEQEAELGVGDGWDEEELLRARQESLRQVLEDRSDRNRGEQSTRHRYAGFPAGAGRMPTREQDVAGPSGARWQQEDDLMTTYGFETSEWRVPAGRPMGSGARQARQPRHQSEYRPLPNMRAAAYVDQHPRHHSQDERRRSLLPQRSPPSRVAGMQSARSNSAERAPQPHPRHTRRTPRNGNCEDAVAREASWWREDYEHDTRANVGGTSISGDSEDDDDRRWCQPEDGEVVPTAIATGRLCNDDPTPVPPGGFPRVHRDDPEARVRGMAVEWIEEMWTDPPKTVLFIDIYNYRYTEDDSYNRQISERLRNRCEQISGVRGFDVVPPEADSRLGARARNLPTTWAIRGLTPDGVARALHRGVWSFSDISFLAFPRATPTTSWVCMLEGFLDGDTHKIRSAILRVLMEGDMTAWIAEMTRSSPDFRGMTDEESVWAVLDSVRVEPMQMGNGNFVTNFFVRPPTRDVREWRRWADDLRSRRQEDATTGTTIETDGRRRGHREDAEAMAAALTEDAEADLAEDEEEDPAEDVVAVPRKVDASKSDACDCGDGVSET